MIKELLENNCIKIGSFKLKSGDISKYYYDMKNLISNPTLLANISDELYKLMDDCDIICGVPIGGLPISTCISVKYNKPMIIVRDEAKEYGTKKCIEGNYTKTDKCIIIDDVISSGSSVQKVVDILLEEVNLVGVVVVIDRQQNFICSLPVKSLYTKTDVVRYRLNELKRTKKSNLCFSADIEYPTQVINILDKIGEHIVVCKIHYDIMWNQSEFKQKLIEASIKYNFLIMEDRKFFDISYIVEKQYKTFQNWVDLVTVHSMVNEDVVTKLSGVMLVANMSNNTYDLTECAKKLATNNPKNVIGFITQKRIDIEPFLNMTPGISLSNNSVDDQHYSAVDKVDTDFIIVGRGIYQSEDMVESALAFLTSV